MNLRQHWKRVAAIAATLLLIAGAVIAIAMATGSSSAGSGPLAMPELGPNSLGVPISLNKPYSFGQVTALNHGDKPVVLDRVELVRADKGITVLGAFVVPFPKNCKGKGVPAPHHCLFYTWTDSSGRRHTSRRTAIGFMPGYHVPHDGRLLRGTTVEPQAQGQVVIGLELTKPGRYRFHAVALDYHRGDKRYRDTFPSSGQICAPLKRYVKNCLGILTSS
jgi:hypothetical protein